jgi:hypothetical protein
VSSIACLNIVILRPKLTISFPDLGYLVDRHKYGNVGFEVKQHVINVQTIISAITVIYRVLCRVSTYARIKLQNRVSRRCYRSSHAKILFATYLSSIQLLQSAILQRYCYD